MEEPLLSSNCESTNVEILNLNGQQQHHHHHQNRQDVTQTPRMSYLASDLGSFKEQLIYGSAMFPIQIDDDDEEEFDEELASEKHDSFVEIPQSARCLPPRSDSMFSPRRFLPLVENLALDIRNDAGTATDKALDSPRVYNRGGGGLGGGKRRNLHKSRTAPAMAAMSTLQKNLDLTREQMQSSQSLVKPAILMLFVYLAVGVVVYHCAKDDFSGKETNSFVDALYFCIVTMCTIGYGDITPQSTTTKLLACFFVLVGFGFIDILLSGMVSLVLTKQENILLHAVEGGHHEIAKTYLVDVKKGRMRIRMKVALALGVVILCIGVGTAMMHSVEKLGWVDSFYLSVMSVTTVGYGDRAFKTMPGRLFASVWLLVSTLAVARAFIYLAEARIEKRHRLIAKWVLQKDMTVQDLIAADIDLNGSVSKSEFVVYKLKQMGRIEPKEIDEITKQFDRLDTDRSGKITISLLGHHTH